MGAFYLFHFPALPLGFVFLPSKLIIQIYRTWSTHTAI